jgi:multidrug efflux system membrane fusion protein
MRLSHESRYKLNLFPLLTLAGLLWGCSPAGHGPGGPPLAQAKGKGLPIPVLAAAAAQKNMPVEATAIGTARAFASIAVKARVDGQLARVAVKQGDEVAKGGLVFQIDPRPFEAALNQAEAILARDAASLENAEADMRRTDELAGTKAVPATVIDANRAKAATLRGSVAADNAALESAKLQLSFCSIVSPVNGRLGLLLVDEGNMVKNNDTTLAVINQTRPIYVDFAVPEQLLPQVRAAAAAGRVKVEATLPQSTEAGAAGELAVINNQVDSTTGTVMLRAVFPNQEEKLWPGQFLNLTLTLGQLANATVVPSQAVQTSQSGEFVFVVKPDGTVEKRPVRLGLSRAGETVVQQGIAPGETVVTDGQLRLVPGAKVEVKIPGQAPAGKPAPGRPA